MSDRKFRATKYGKGDARRTENRTAFQLGMEAYQVAMDEGTDSDRYRDLHKAWKKAVKNGR